MMSFDLIKYQWEMGCYSLEDMMVYVELKYITKEDFHTITGYNYDGVTSKKNKAE